MNDEKIVLNADGNEVRSGLGGWLILVGLGVVLSPVRLIYLIYTTYPPIFDDGTYELVTTPGTEAYHPFWSFFIWFELSVNSVMVYACIYLAYLFFSKKSLFPKFYIWISVGSLAFILLDAVLLKVVLPNEPIFDPDTLREVARSTFVVLVWVGEERGEG